MLSEINKMKHYNNDEVHRMYRYVNGPTPPQVKTKQLYRHCKFCMVAICIVWKIRETDKSVWGRDYTCTISDA